MNTTVETSRTSSSYTTSRSRVPFTDKNTNLDGGSSVNLTSTVTLSNPQDNAAASYAPPAGGHLHYSDLPREDRLAARDTLKELSHQGRLWVNEGNQLRRAEPAEIKERLDNGQPVELVSRLGGEIEQSGRSSSSSYDHSRGFFAHGVSNHESSSYNSETVRVNYSRSPLTSWDSLDFVETDQPGVTGTGTLPGSGGLVTLSSDYESQWERSRNEAWGIFTEKGVHDNDSSFSRVHSQA